ncbi:MAG: SDR family NAD(P)-dependent oxidoreductase [Nostoc sp. S4]|nr:SDR family NAD(P)-dependent oxidoreductase [Nostoc sp. S4]
MAGKLDAKVAIVTGASSGIGAATAIALAEEGAQVAIAARRIEQLNEVAQKIEAVGAKALPIVTDVSDETQVNELIQKVNTTLGRIDILVNNAGTGGLGTIEDSDPAEWRQQFDLNVLGLLYATHAVLPIFKAQGVGHVVNLSSVAGRITRPGMGVYSATKCGVNAISEALRQEVHKDNIRVTIIEPGLVATEFIDNITDPAAKRALEARFKAVTPLQPEDIARAIAYAVTQPPHVNVNEILIRPTQQE